MDKVLQQFDTTYRKLITDYPCLASMCDPVRYKTTIRLLAEHCPQGGIIADIGAWPGGLTACLSRMGWQTIAVDKEATRSVVWEPGQLLRTDFLDDAKQEKAFSFAHLCHAEAITAITTDIEADALPMASDSLDAVVCTEVIEHLWHDPLLALSEINRVLKKDTGILLLSTPNLLSLRNRLNFLQGNIEQVIEHPFVSYLKYRRVGHLGHVRLYAPQELTTMLSFFGFQTHISFTKLGQYDSASHRVPVHRGGDSADIPPRMRRQSAVLRVCKKCLRSPYGYWAALYATSLAWLEHTFPHFRPQIFIVGKKINDANFERNYPQQLHDMILKNSLG